MMRHRPSALWAPVALVVARARHRPQQWLWPVLGIVVAVGFAGAIATEAVISADRAARSTLRGLGDLDRAVRITWQGPVRGAASVRARGVLRGLDLGPQTEVTLLDPVR